jgi:hypothetical protein
VFGYSAPKTDVEAVDLMKEAWGQVEERRLEQTEIIARPGADHDELHKTWDPFIHTHHYDIVESFYESWLGNLTASQFRPFSLVVQRFFARGRSSNSVPSGPPMKRLLTGLDQDSRRRSVRLNHTGTPRTIRLRPLTL